MTIEVRRIRDGELRAFIETLSAGFLERPDIDKLTDEIRPLWDLDRTWAAFEDGRMCGTYRSWATELTVPGGQRLPAAAVSAVTVLPTHRRRGILRAMVEAEHAAITGARRGIRSPLRGRVRDLRQVRVRPGPPRGHVDAFVPGRPASTKRQAAESRS